MEVGRKKVKCFELTGAILNSFYYLDSCKKECGIGFDPEALEEVA